jgi:hypothetical protein
MTRNQRLSSYAVLAASLGLAAMAGATFADQAAPAVEAQATPATSTPVDTSQFLSLSEIESRLTAQGIRVEEMEVKDKVIEVEGRSTQDGKVELIVDRRSGEILSRKKDD